MKKLSLLAFCTLILVILLAACGDPTQPSSNVTSTTVPAATTPGGSLFNLPVGTVTPTATTTVAPTTTDEANPETTTPAVTTKPAKTTTPAATTTPAETTTPAATATTPAATTTIAPAEDNLKKPQYVLYNKGSFIYAYNITTQHTTEVSKERSVLSYAVSTDQKKVAFITHDDKTVQLALVTLDGDNASDVVILDKMVGPFIPATEDNPYLGMYQRGFSLNFSPDGKTIAYTKTNLNGPVFDCWGSQVHPTEVWSSDLSGKTRRLVANNDKNFMFKVAFSPDGARVGFLKTDNFHTDVGGTSSVWSVHNDGTTLSLLEDGAKLTRVVNPKAGTDEPGQIYNFTWTGPTSVSFFLSSAATSTVWVHDLSNNKGQMLIGPETGDAKVIYDPVSKRYAYTSDKGVYTVSATTGKNVPVLVKQGLKDLISFYGHTVFFLTQDKAVALQSINENGSPLSVALGLRGVYQPGSNIEDALPGYSNWVVSWSDEGNNNTMNLAVFSGDGHPLVTKPVEAFKGQLQPIGDGVFLIKSYEEGLQVLDIAGDYPILQTVVTGNDIYQSGD